MEMETQNKNSLLATVHGLPRSAFK